MKHIEIEQLTDKQLQEIKENHSNKTGPYIKVTRQQALVYKLQFYYTGIPCKKAGHIDLKYLKDTCRTCATIRDKVRRTKLYEENIIVENVNDKEYVAERISRLKIGISKNRVTLRSRFVTIHIKRKGMPEEFNVIVDRDDWDTKLNFILLE
jgi:hypothetical protein